MNGQYLLEVNHLKKTVNEFTIRNMNFNVEPGYIVGVIGRNGAGKTTLLNTILGIYQPEEGEIFVCGMDRVHNALEAKKRMAFVTDECLFPLDLSPKNIGIMYGVCYDDFNREKYQKLCKRFEVPYKKTLRKMSKGTVAKAQLAFAMSRDAALYILDEPTAGLDPVFRKELLEYFFEVVADGTKSIILSTNLTDELDRIADYILYIDKGSQRLYMEKEELLNQYRMIRGTAAQVDYYRDRVVGMKKSMTVTEALIRNTGDDYPVAVTVEIPSMEEIMMYCMNGGNI